MFLFFNLETTSQRNKSMLNLPTLNDIDQTDSQTDTAPINKTSITGSRRGRVLNKRRDLFASSDDIFGACNTRKSTRTVSSSNDNRLNSSKSTNRLETVSICCQSGNQANEAQVNQDKRVIFIPIDNRSAGKRDVTLNRCYGAQLECPAMDLQSDRYVYKYSTGGHKYFTQVNCID